MIDVELSGVTKSFPPGIKAVDDFSISVPRGSFTTLLGPSGCGKTTLLRILAGFLEPDAGRVVIGGKDQKGVPPEIRSTGIVFQDYALFPHMNVRENLVYGLTVKRVPTAEKDREAFRVAEMLGIRELLARYPDELSGGQQQRVALGKALARRPQILLMDEPFSSLDAKLRFHIREELKSVQKTLGVTTIYVTHDQEEALSLSDYIAVMRGGRLEQLGTPREIYDAPKTAFAADFSGAANFIEEDGATCLVRPEWITPEPDTGAGFSDDGTHARTDVLHGVVEGEDYLGRCARLRVRTDSGQIVSAYLAASDSEGGFGKGERVRLVIQKKVVL